MNLFRKPVFWGIGIAAVFAFTIGSQTPSCCEASVDKTPADDRQSNERAAPTLSVAANGALDEGAVVTALEQLDVDDGVNRLLHEKVADSEQDGNALAVVTASDGALGQPDEESHVGGPTEEESEAPLTSRPRMVSYVVQPGETVSVIAERFNISKETILAANDLVSANLLREGERLNILTTDGAIHRVQRGESLWDIARMYRADLDQIVEMNEISDPSRVLPAQEIIVPGTEAASIGSTLRTNRVVGADGRLLQAFSWPVSGRISSRYGTRWGSMHHGVDVAVVTGTPVRAAAAGRVSFAGWNGGYGNLVVIDHGDRVETRYAHNSRLVVEAGQRVRRGDLVAYSGNTGRSTGPHVHFEIRRNGQSVNPLNYLR